MLPWPQIDVFFKYLTLFQFTLILFQVIKCFYFMVLISVLVNNNNNRFPVHETHQILRPSHIHI